MSRQSATACVSVASTQPVGEQAIHRIGEPLAIAFEVGTGGGQGMDDGGVKRRRSQRMIEVQVADLSVAS
jgi:hypothetical protein